MIKVFEAFSGIGTQRMALRPATVRSMATADCIILGGNR